MRSVLDIAERDRAIARLAARKRGLVTRPELIAAGLSGKTIRRWLAAGRLHELFGGVYLVGHTVAPPLARELGAVLACGPASFLSHFSAAELWELLKVPRDRIDVTVVRRNPAKRPGINLHRTRRIDRGDVTRRAGILVARPGRILLDLADCASTGQLERAWDEAHSRDLINPDQIQKLIRRSPGRHGIPRRRTSSSGTPPASASRRPNDA